MRKALILTLLLLALSISGICLAHINVNAARDKVELTETVLYGDKAAAEGLSVDVSTHCDHHLFWDTSYIVGEESVDETKYTFSQAELHGNSPTTYHGVELSAGLEYGFDPDAGEEQTGIAAAYKELFDATPPGEERGMTVYLKDYYEYYPIGVMLDLPGTTLHSSGDVYTDISNPEPGSSEYVIEAFRDFFRIPVLEEELLELSVTKSSDGDLRGLGSGSTKSNSFNIWAKCALTDDACYFTFNSHTSDGSVVDTSLIPGGYGIYRLPYDTTGNKEIGADVDALAMVCSLDPTAEIVGLYTNQDKTKLLLLTLEDEKSVLTVIDISTMDMLQRLEIGDDGIWYVFNYEDFMALALSDSRLVVLSVTDTNEYEICISTELTDPENPLYYLDINAVMDWDGSRLAVSGFLEDEMERYNNCGFYLAVYDDTGLLYYGEYASSLDAGAVDYAYRCKPGDNAPLAVSWGE